MSIITNKKDLIKLRQAGKFLAKILKKSGQMAVPGTNLLEIDQFIHDQIEKKGFKPSFKGFQGYPTVSCLSLNSEVVHAIPRDYHLRDKDIVGIDTGFWHDNVVVDAAITVGVGKIRLEDRKLLEVTQSALNQVIPIIKPGIRVGDISHFIESIAKKRGLGIIKSLTGHGVGYAIHDDPSIPNYGQPGTGPVIEEGSVLAIEPMFTNKRGETKILTDGWTVETMDKSNAAQFEHTVLVNRDSSEIITS